MYHLFAMGVLIGCVITGLISIGMFLYIGSKGPYEDND